MQQELRTAFEFVEGSTTTSSAPSVADDVVADVEPDLPGGISAELARARFPEDGDALARLEIPAIELDKFVMRDVDRRSRSRSAPAITAAHHDPVSPATAPSQVVARPMERRSNGSTSCAR